MFFLLFDCGAGGVGYGSNNTVSRAAHQRRNPQRTGSADRSDEARKKQKVVEIKAIKLPPMIDDRAIGTSEFSDAALQAIWRAVSFLADHPLRVACQVPLQRSPVMIPAHRPLPELPASRPLPLALDAPTEILTETAPPRLMPPVTLPPPADETRVPATVKGTLLLELQLPRWVANKTFQTPS